MDQKTLDLLKNLVEEARRSLDEETLDYEQMSAPCGIPCFECPVYLASANQDLQTMISKVLGIPVEQVVCKGCRNEDGKCAHLPMPCRLYPCAQEKGLGFCHECSDFPCDYLHPYADQAFKWHNTKVFNLCLMKKMGLETWAKEKARSVCDTYFWGEWTL